MSYPGVQNQPDEGRHRGVVGQSLQRFLRSQFGRPAGLWGRVVGRIMARTPSNLERIHWTVSLLEPKPNDRILEIGYGPGIAIQELSQIVRNGWIAGVDHSEVMMRQASKRNAQAIREGRVVLHVGSASELPSFEQPFDKIFTINSIHFWPEPLQSLKTLHGMLKPGGIIAVTIQPRSRNSTDETTRLIGEELTGTLALAGFSQCRLQIRPMQPVAVACVIGVKS